MLSGLINVGESSVAIASIRTDGGTQPREGLDAKYIDDLVEALTNGATLPPVDLMYDGDRYWLYDGFHRLAAHKAVNRVMISARVHQGDQAAAQWESYAANQSHGLRRSQADKERAIRAALKHPNGAKLANSLIAKHLGVSDNTVRKYREDMESASQIAKVTERQGADGKVYNTANIGANRPAAQSPSRRYESGLPALNMPSPRPAIGAQPKMPVTDWELSDICETVANEMFGDITRSRVVALTRIMVSDATTKQGGYWDKLLRTLAPFDAAVTRIQAAVADAAQRMVAERGGADTEPEASAPAPAAKPPMTPEAKELSREIKAATWGDKPYAEVWEIQSALGNWQHNLDATGLRNLARFRGGADWFDCRVALGEMRYRDRDLVQALNNLASQMEQRAEGETGREGETADPWAAAWASRQYDQLINRCQRLAGAMLPWAQAWTDDKGRTWRDLVDRNPQHANSPFRQDAVAECKRRGLIVHEEGMAETIRRLFGLLVESDNRLLSDGDPIEMPDDLVDVWSPRFDGAGVYLVDVVRNRSTGTVALDDIAELFAQARRMDGALDAEGETLTAADLQVMQAAPATVLPDKGYAMQSDVEAWLEQVAATPEELREAAETRHGRVWEKLMRQAAAAGYALSEATPRAALQNMANQREYEQRKAQALRGAPVVPLTPPIEPPITVPLKPAPDDRVGKMVRLIAGYQATISTFDEYGELIGAHLETLPAKRELEKLIKHLRREIDLLEGKVVEEAWG